MLLSIYQVCKYVCRSMLENILLMCVCLWGGGGGQEVCVCVLLMIKGYLFLYLITILTMEPLKIIRLYSHFWKLLTHFEVNYPHVVMETGFKETMLRVPDLLWQDNNYRPPY